MFLCFPQGSLPWQGLTARDQAQKDELILHKKKTIGIRNLYKNFPEELATYIDHIRSLNDDKTPKYAYLRKNFRKLFLREGFDHDHVFNWTILKYFISTQ